ncbi:rab-GTPase-TBC domain-domain-containing protein [Leucosporidium creatinivorum]|uniref:Rab-GTPase-TBC domain-domain-containing protein n=1 Tax=Leucosporidium creatinivorum TaxID=106004 RepID=A0A1Y2EVM7_9BASI|nr:rab-GTPase-TBC domain-domain-containing protein [Leucosporidium creatinivorum]
MSSTLRRQQNKSYYVEPTKEDLFRLAFALPEGEEALGEVHAVLTLQGKQEAFSGKLYLSTSFLTFTSLDRRSCRLTLPLATVRRVEKLAPGQDGTIAGAFALSLTLFHGLRIVVQLNSLRPTNDAFCANLRTRLKASLPMMKALKPFSHTFFSEWYLSPDRELDGEAAAAKKQQDEKVGELISFDDEKGKGKEEEQREFTTEGDTGHGYHGGLGLIFKFPGDPRKLREKSKMKLWKEYLEQHGRNLTLIRYPSFTRLVLVGLPNRLRGEMWELTCGSMFLRLHNPGVYARLLKENAGRRSASTDDIEKDLHRSLPEYAAYQDKVGIDTMRRVLTAYSWSNPALGYCQAMNLITASFLIYMSEEQCFWCLTVLCDRLLPGYYSPSMYGTVLDQRVFEHLVQRCLPSIHDHFAEADVQLSVASLPWFLSLYISSLPMVFAFRIIDCFFLMGPKVLFQVGLAILKVNGPELLQTTDDGAFINVLKRYFATLGESAHPNSSDSRTRQITKFQELFVVAFREFAIITDETIASERKRFRAEVVISIETFAKRSAIRNLKDTGRLDKAQLGLAYDHFQLASLRSKEQARRPSAADALSPKPPNSTGASPRTPSSASFGGGSGPKDEEKVEERIDRKAFGRFLGDIASWARDEKLVKNGFHEHIDRQPVDHELVDRIFVYWDQSLSGALSFQDIVTGLDAVLFNDLMSNLAWLFNVHDSNHDGYLTKDEVLQVSESLLFIFRNEPGDRYLGSVSNLIQNLFEYAESTKPEENPPRSPSLGRSPDPSTGRPRANSIVSDNPHRPYLALATFRMCILADPLLEDFFESDLTNSWRLEVLIAEEKPKQPGAGGAVGGWWGGIVNAVMTDENKERLNRLADEVGKRLDIQTIEHRPSIGKLDAAAAAIEPQARDSLFSTSNRPPKQPASPEIPNPLSAAAMRMPAYPPTSNPWADASSSGSSSPNLGRHEIDVQAAASQALHRQQFVIDDVAEGDDEDYAGGEGDAELMNQVERMLVEDEAVTGKAAQSGQDLLKQDGQSLL